MIDNKEKIRARVIDALAKGSNGQLTVFEPEDKSVVDLVVKKRGQYYDGRSISIQIRELKKNYQTSSLFSEGGVDPSPDLYLLLACFDVVSQNISNYIWLIPSAENVLKVELPLDALKDKKYSKFLVSQDNLADLIEDILKKGAKFIFPKADVPNAQPEELKDFIISARRNTFESAPEDNPRLKSSIEFTFSQGDWFYQNIYFVGKKNIIGQEIVYFNTKPIWAMGYSGDVADKKTSLYLKEVLLKLDCRIGASCELKKKAFSYQDKGKKSLDRFSGEETISVSSEIVYRLNYYGGLII